MTEEKVSFQLQARLSELNRIKEMMGIFGKVHNLPRRAVFQLSLVLEELISNFIKYGCRDDREHSVSVSLFADGGTVTVEVEDDGLPFDPFSADKGDIESPHRERKIGGLGIHLVRNIMDEVRYERRKDRNFVVMRKRLKGAEDGVGDL